MKNSNHKTTVKSVVNNSIYTLSGKIVTVIFYMLLDVCCARLLTVDKYAEWIFFFTILTVFYYICWLGINTSAKVYVSKQIDETGKAKIIKAALYLRFFVSTLISFAIFIWNPVISSKLGYPVKYPDLFILLYISVFLVFFNSFTELFKELFMGINEFKNFFIFNAIEYIGYFFFVLILLLNRPNVLSVAAGYLITQILLLLFGSYFFVNKLGNKIKLVKYCEIRKYIWKIFRYAIPLGIINLGGIILIEMDTFMLGIMCSKVQVANYAIAKNICSKAAHINYSIAAGSMTSFSILNSQNIAEKQNIYKKIQKINVLVSLFIAACVVIAGKIAVNILYGPDYANVHIILIWLTPYYIMYGISILPSTFLDFQGKAKYRSICYLSVIILNLIFNMILIPLYGENGAAIATSLSLVPYFIMVLSGSHKTILDKSYR